MQGGCLSLCPQQHETHLSLSLPLSSSRFNCVFSFLRYADIQRKAEGVCTVDLTGVSFVTQF